MSLVRGLKNSLAAWAALLVAVVVAVDMAVTPLVTLDAEIIPAKEPFKETVQLKFKRNRMGSQVTSIRMFLKSMSVKGTVYIIYKDRT